MTDLSNLPSSLTPFEFFDEVLPEILGEVEIPAGVGEERLQITVTGDEGLELHLGLEDGEMTMEEGQADAPPIALTISDRDFVSLLAGDLRDKVKAATGGVAIGPRQLRKAFLPAAVVEKIKDIHGDLQVRIVDKDDDETYVATVTFGGGAPNVAAPTCTVVIEVPTLIEMVTGAQPAQQLFFQGKIRIDGDMSIVLNLMAIMSAPA